MSEQSNVALIDLDATLLDMQYRVTDERIYPTVQRLQQKGWRIGLSSDTPYEGLKIWQDRFGMRGPMIAERGAIVVNNDTVRYDEATAAAFARTTQAAAEIATKRYVFWQGNPVEAMRGGLRIGEPGDTAVLLNNLRRCSFSYFVRRVETDGALRIANDRTAAVAAEFRDCYPDFADVEEDVNDDYGIVIVSRASTTKRHGTQQLMGSLGVNRVAMLGNSMGDYIGEDIADQFAVGNADPPYADLSVYQAPSPYTTGVCELLEYLESRS